MFWFTSKDKIQNLPEGNDKRERLFFHDLINHTHGLQLYLNQRIAQNISISPSECELLTREIKTLQSLIKDHFHLNHKNLPHTPDWVNFSSAELSLMSLIQTYLPTPMVKTFIHLSGELSYEKSVSSRANILLHFPTFYRIMNNLIKNMAEARCREVHLNFDYGNHGLIIETRNKFNSSNDLKSLADKIDQLILDGSPDYNKLGLESIHHLAQEAGGVFEFEVSNDEWVNRISLPKNKDQEQKVLKVAA
jgi:hypothetical protein